MCKVKLLTRGRTWDFKHKAVMVQISYSVLFCPSPSCGGGGFFVLHLRKINLTMCNKIEAEKAVGNHGINTAERGSLKEDTEGHR